MTVNIRKENTWLENQRKSGSLQENEMTYLFAFGTLNGKFKLSDGFSYEPCIFRGIGRDSKSWRFTRFT